MANTPLIVHGSWWVPEGNVRFNGNHHTGTLTYTGTEPTILEIYHEPTQGVISRNYMQYDVIWGSDANGNDYTLFGAVVIRQQNFTKTTFKINYILIGAHVNSLNEPCFDLCITEYPHLRELVFESRVKPSSKDGNTIIELDDKRDKPIMESMIEDGVRAYLWSQLTTRGERFSVSIEQSTNFDIEIPEKASIGKYLSIISKFTHFLSIALFCQQNPSAITLKNKGEYHKCSLLFVVKKSSTPLINNPLIKYNELKEKMPNVLKTWYRNHEQISPIAQYLVRSLGTEPFDTPDFLIIAQALDGYFKRFVNKKDGKDVKQYKQQIEKLLKRYEGVEALKKCRIDSEVLTQSRHKYSHLIPDGEKGVEKAAVGRALFWLTEKCKVLLTCCILDMLGLTIDEINICCKASPVWMIVDSLPFEDELV